MKKAVIAGGSGLIGQAVIERLSANGYEVVNLTRDQRGVWWDAKSLGPWVSSLEGTDAVINLSGSPIAVRWTPENREKILSSRGNATRAIAEAISQCAKPPRVWINASAIGWYGHTGSREASEGDPAAPGFLGQTCKAWEEATTAFPTPQTRVVCARFGVVLSRKGGALRPFERLAKLFLGGSAGSGSQFMSWIHIADAVASVEAMIEGSLTGPVNICSPNAVSNERFMRALREALHRPYCPPAPKLFLRIGSRLAGVETEMILNSQRVAPRRLLDSGFAFQFLTIEDALADLYR